MFLYLLLLFTLLPLFELSLLIWIGRETSIWFTIGLVLCTGILGAALARWQGVFTLRKIQRQMANREAPTDAMLDALLIFVAGLLLITPGIITDATGFLLLLPFARIPIKKWLKSKIRHHSEQQFSSMKAQFFTFGEGFAGANESSEDPEHPTSKVIEAQVISPPVKEDEESD